MSDSHTIVTRLRSQAGAPSFVWHEVMMLLLEGANEIERVRNLYMDMSAKHDDLLMELRKAYSPSAAVCESKEGKK